MSMSQQHQISRDPTTILEKAKQEFSWREFGYIAAEQYCRINTLPNDDGLGARGDMENAFSMWHYGHGLPGAAFISGWDSYMIEHGRLVREEEEHL